MNKTIFKELTWGAIAVASIAMGVINIYCPLSSWKILIVSATALLLSICQLFDEVLDIYISEEKLNKKLCELCDIVDAPKAEFQKEKLKRFFEFLVWGIYVISLILLVVGLTLDIPLFGTKIADTISFVSLGFIFFSMCFNSWKAKRIDVHYTISHDLERAKGMLNASDRKE